MRTGCAASTPSSTRPKSNMRWGATKSTSWLSKTFAVLSIRAPTRRASNRWWGGRTLWHLTALANYLGRWEASLDYCRRGLDHGIALQDLRLTTVGWTRMGLAHIQQGDVERGLECCEEALALAPIQRDGAFARVVRGYGKIKAGRLDDGIAELREALAWFESSHMQWTYVIGAVWLAEGHLRAGDRAAARPLIAYVLETSRATGYRHTKAGAVG